MKTSSSLLRIFGAIFPIVFALRLIPSNASGLRKKQSEASVPRRLNEADCAAAAGDCFMSKEELEQAVDAYLRDPSAMSKVAQKYGHPIGTWCVDNIQDFSHLFDVHRNPAAGTFNAHLTCWNTRNAKDMSYMFAGAKHFNGDVSKFNTANVRKMEGMFEDALSFDQNIGDWYVFAVKSFGHMFNGAVNFNQDISEWMTNCATDMSYMFYSAFSFNSDISNWKVSKVTDFKFMFMDAFAFEQNLCSWAVQLNRDVPSANMIEMFGETSCPVQAEPAFSESANSYETLCYDCKYLFENP